MRPGDMLRNARTGEVDVHPHTGLVSLAGESLHTEPADTVALSRLYHL